MNVNDDINNVLSKIAKLEDYDYSKTKGKFSNLYPFTTENLNGYLSNLDLKNKSILTVGSSSDQVLNAIFFGAKDVACFDINPYAKYYFDLKKAAIKGLNYDEFLTYFCYSDWDSNKKNRESFNIKSYKKISQYLSKNSRIFWDSLYLEFSPEQIRENLFSNDEYGPKVLKNINSYLIKENYNLLKTRIDNVNPKFIVCEINDIVSKAKGKYDYVFLSNVLIYLVKAKGINYLNDFKILLDDLGKKVNDNGKIFIAYDYNSDYAFHFLKKDDILKVFGENNIEYKKFEGMYNFIKNEKHNHDGVYIYNKINHTEHTEEKNM